MKCFICQSEYFNKRRKKYKGESKSKTCSRACNAIRQNKIKEKNFIPNDCRQCGKKIKVRQSARKFCSVRCQHLWWRGENHYRWQGIQVHSEGYLLVKDRFHPFADKRGNLLQHRVIIEDYLRLHDSSSKYLVNLNGTKWLKPGCVVHHKNGIKADNRVSNLLILENQSEHMRVDNPRN